MMSPNNPTRFTETTLQAICTLVTDGTHDTPAVIPKGIPLIKAKEINGGTIDFGSCDYIAESEHEKIIERSKPEYGDTLFTHIGASLGLSAFVNTHREFSIKNIALFKPNPKAVAPRYLSYLVKSDEFQKLIKGARSGAAQPFVGLATLRNHRIRIYSSVDIQTRIADILSAYDDLIENNNRRMALLEEAIHLLYREWFVYLRFPGHERVKVVDGVPEGWQRIPIGQVCEVFDGPHATPKPSEDGPVFLGIKNLTDSGQLDLSTVRHISEAEYAKWTKRVIPEPGDIVFTYEATLHQYGVIPRGFRGCLGRRTALLRPKKAGVGASFLLPMLRSRSWIDYMESQKLHGATVDRISIKKFPSFEMLLPSASALEAFREVAQNSLELRERLQEQNQRLREARDLLLPRLMNGSIAV